MVKKLKVPFHIEPTNLANGKFQYNMECIQFLYNLF